MRQALGRFITKLRELLAPLFHRYDQKLPYIITAVLFLIIVVVGINLFIELTDTLKTETLGEYDQRITDYVLSYRTPFLTQYFLLMTYLGDVYGYLVLLAIYFLISVAIFKKWKYIAQTSLVLLLATVSNVMLKRFIDRARPGIEHLVSVETLSYPSGHAMSAMAFYGFLTFLIYKFKINKFLKFGIIVLLVILILSIGLSRIYLGVHFPSDIVGGYIAGFIWVVFCVLIFDLIEVFKKDPKT
jgi:undecaprenyl-diphosphatase